MKVSQRRKPFGHGDALLKTWQTPGMDSFTRGFGYEMAYAGGFGFVNPSHGAKSGWQWMGIGIGRAKGYNAWKELKNVRKMGGFGKAASVAGKRFGLQAFGLGLSALIGIGNFSEGYSENGLVGGLASVPGTVLDIGIGAGVAGVGARLFKGTTGALKASGSGIAQGWTQGSIGKMLFKGGSPLLRQTAVVAGRVVTNPVVVAYSMWNASLSHIRNDAFTSLDRYQKTLGLGHVGSLAAFQTQGAWTSRQMSMQAIQRSHLNARSALGNESQYMHR